MTNVWNNQAASLKSAIKNQAIVSFLESHTPEQIAAAAGADFAALGEREQASIIQSLIAQAQSANRVVEIEDLPEMPMPSVQAPEVVCEYCGGDGYHAVPRTPGVDCEACKGTGNSGSA